MSDGGRIGEVQSVERLSWVLREWRLRLAALPMDATDPESAVSIVDRVEQPAGLARLRTAYVAFVDAPSTDNTDNLRDDIAAEVVDDIRVVLFAKINPKDQNASADQARDFEERVIEWLTAWRSWHGDWHVSYRGSQRGPHADSAEWWVSDQSYRIRRYLRLGG